MMMAIDFAAAAAHLNSTNSRMLPSIVPRLQSMVLSHPLVAKNPKLSQFCEHPAGPFTIHFWAPTFKWVISLANVADMRKSPDCISLSQQMAVTATGVIWSRYSLIINPVNYNLFSVNVFMAGTGMIQLYRKLTYSPPAASSGSMISGS